MQFVCRVGTPDGRVLEDTFNAPDEVALRSDLDKRGYHIFDIRRRGVPGKVSARGLAGGLRRKRIPDAEFLIFNQELAALLKAGLPLLQTLDLMLERMANQNFKAVLGEIRDRVKSGEDLSEAFAEYGHMFPRLYPSSLKAGERSGELEKVIRRFIRYLKLLLEARKRVISALVYPAVLVGLSIAMLVVMAVYVVPKFQVFFQDLNVELPLLTRITLGVSAFLTQRTLFLWNWGWLVVAVAVGVASLRRAGRTTEGRIAIDAFKMRLPLLGPVLHRFALSEFTRALSTLLSGGIPLVPAFEIAVSAVGNAQVRSKLEPTIQMVREGKAFHAALETSGVMTDMSIDMVKVGEATGSLDEMLMSVSDFLDDQVETRMQRLLSLVEPIMLVVMGIIIGLLLVSIYLPMFSMLGQTEG
jgi:type IV pilus assembly protein PilC